MGYYNHVLCQVIHLCIQEESRCITALGLACKCGHKAIAELLILKGAKVNYQDKVRLLVSSQVMRKVASCYIIFSDWFHTTPLGKSEWSLGCSGVVNRKSCTN